MILSLLSLCIYLPACQPGLSNSQGRRKEKGSGISSSLSVELECPLLSCISSLISSTLAFFQGRRTTERTSVCQQTSLNFMPSPTCVVFALNSILKAINNSCTNSLLGMSFSILCPFFCQVSFMHFPKLSLNIVITTLCSLFQIHFFKPIFLGSLTIQRFLVFFVGGGCS